MESDLIPALGVCTPDTVLKHVLGNGTTGEQNNDTSAITSPETGDKMNLVLWIALLVVSASTVIGTAVANRKTI